MIRVALVGNPNSGKTSLFNALTGSNYKVANYPGVTVEYKESHINVENQAYTLVDLPGIYSLNGASAEEKITHQELLTKDLKFDLVIAVLDACNLERNLFLLTELIDQGFKVVLAITMLDLAAKKDIFIRESVLSTRLELPVIKVQAKTKSGVNELWSAIKKAPLKTQHSPITGKWKSFLKKNIQNQTNTEPPDRVTEAAARYDLITTLLKEVLVCASCPERSWKTSADEIISHKVLGLLIFAFVMFAMFQSVFNLAALPMEWIEWILAQLGKAMIFLMPDGQLRSLIVDGIIGGVGSVLVFVPQIFILFFLIGLLEDSAYLTRAAFLMDKLMRTMGLQGRSFIPLLNSFACAIPGITAARTISSERDRLITILIAPLMSCSARLPIYTVLIAAFIPNILILGVFPLQGLTMFGLYLLGIIAAVIVAIILKFLLPQKNGSLFIFEMPPLRRPSIQLVLRQSWERALAFVKNAGGFILACSVLLWFLSTYPSPETTLSPAEAVKQSYAGQLGQFIEPALKPLGYNWEIAISIIASFAAREVFVSSLSTVFNLQNDSEPVSSLTNLLSERAASGQGFGLATALSLLVFYVFACQCLSTVAVCRKETNSWKWTFFMFAYMTALAYCGAFITYQIANSL